METYEGRVSRRLVAQGSKSEHEALTLETPDGELILRRVGGNPFRDDTLEPLLGKRVRVAGTRRGRTLLVTSWEVTG